MEIDSPLVALQNQLTITPKVREPRKPVDPQQQPNQPGSGRPAGAQTVVRQNNPEALADVERYSQQQQDKVEYSDYRATKAIDTYQSLAKHEQRDEIQSLFGVDTFV
ncbi:hypothetical protein [Aliiglaciecola sp. LCG003]|uniref:hypothetical protein n=1 Tax=Aliiglaciecola sp. LCG003 TaxID=3053655 RepID=UPI0025745C83|nr:hypothetical protein [Aliiglaciecola sp. LCG003]WJG08209.1 hypothetical protein QR722_12770 [Aliiglaciecola sp. LCG003]